MQVNNRTRVFSQLALTLSLLLFLIGYFYRESIIHLFSLWNNVSEGDFAHGYMVVLISLYLIYLRRNELTQLPVSPNVGGLFLVLGSSLAWAVSIAVDVITTQGAMLIFLLLGIVWSVLGTAYVKALALPILYLMFAVPIWTLLSPALQTLVVNIVFPISRMMDIPVLREGHLLVVPYGQLSIEEACSGLRYLLAALTLGVLYAYLNYTSLKARILVVCVAIVAAITGNILRVLAIVYLAYTSEMTHPWVEDHLMMGWILFGILFFILLILDVWISRHRRTSPPGPTPAIAESYATLPKVNHAIGAGGYAIMLGALLFTATGPFLLYKHSNSEIAGNFESDRYTLHASIDGWSKQNIDDNIPWKPSFSGALEKTAHYLKDGDRVQLYYGYYANQRQDSELINELNTVSGKRGWRTVRTRPEVIVDAKGHDFMEQIIQSIQGEKRLVWYRYTVAGFNTSDKYTAKLLQAVGLLTGRYEADVVVMSTALGDETGIARNTLTDFYHNVVAGTREGKP